MSSTHSQDEYLDCKQSTAFTSLSQRMFWKLIQEGTLVAYRPSRRRTLVKRSAVENWLEASRSGSNIDTIVDEVVRDLA
ncbi:MAG: hypothetical protein AB7P18_34685 [Candidatus Binatia bacterium]